MANLNLKKIVSIGVLFLAVALVSGCSTDKAKTSDTVIETDAPVNSAAKKDQKAAATDDAMVTAEPAVEPSDSPDEEISNIDKEIEALDSKDFDDSLNDLAL